MSRPAALSQARDFWTRRAPIVLLAWGVVVRVEQFATRRSLWLDEATLAINFVSRPFSQLADPLGNGQGAPVGYLFVERSAVALFGNNEYALRLFPLVCAIASLFVFLHLARKLLPAHVVPVAAGLFALSPMLIYYAGEAKQYAVDVLVALVLTAVMLRMLDRERLSGRDAVIVGATGAVAAWFSHAAILVLAAAGVVLLIVRGRRDAPRVLAAGGVWLASIAIAYVVSLRSLSSNQVLLDYWRGAFVPSPFGPGGTLRWFAGTGRHFLVEMGGFSLWPPAAVLAVLGAVALWRRAGAARVALLAGPAIALLAAAAAQTYPARGRLVLFLVPAALLLVAASLAAVPPRVGAVGTVAIAAALAAAAASPVATSAEYFARPITKTETREAFQLVGGRWLEGDALYLHHGADAAYRYYAPVLDLPPARVFLGTDKSPCDDRAELADLRAARRVWVVFGHQFAGAPRGEREIIASHVSVVGRLVGAFRPPGAAAYLYDTAGTPDDPSGARARSVPGLRCVELRT